jgi:hypothetical protein
VIVGGRQDSATLLQPADQRHIAPVARSTAPAGTVLGRNIALDPGFR